jgi:hypothetical protein
MGCGNVSTGLAINSGNISGLANETKPPRINCGNVSLLARDRAAALVQHCGNVSLMSEPPWITGDTWSPVQEMFPGPIETEPPPWFRYNRSLVVKILVSIVEPTCIYTIIRV